MIHPLRSKDHIKPKSRLFFRRDSDKDGVKKPGFISRKLKLRKHFWKTLIADILLWISFIGVILFVPPDSQFGVELFFTALFGAILLLGYLILNHKRRSVLITLAIVGLVLLRFLKLDTWLNAGMLVGLLITVELLFVVD
jgi:hypothetical protein